MNKTTANRTIIRFFDSWATVDNPFNSTTEIINWIKEQNNRINVQIKKQMPNYKTGNWHYDPHFGDIRNDSGSFFQIKGLQKIDNGKIVLNQPIILQDEIGYLGIICKVIDGVLYFLMQAKIEPGNVNKIQISPTIQATKSNFMQAHGGRIPAYLEYFMNSNRYEIVVDQIQSEQSSRFYGKRNRNIIIVVDEEIEVLESHKWMTLGQIKQLMKYDNLINMDTRTVISCIPFSFRDFSKKELLYIRGLFSDKAFFNSMFFGDSYNTINRIFQYINNVKMLDKTEIRLIDLFDLKDWTFNEVGELCSKNGDFKVIYCNIDIDGREVRHWEQPLLEAVGQSTFGLIYCIDSGVRYYLVHAKSEVGCFDKIEIGPSVQLGPNDIISNSVDKLFIQNIEKKKGIEFSGIFSEEGGRFYQEQNRNILMKIEKTNLPKILPDGYFWVDFQTLNTLTQFNNCLNIQLRNLISILAL